MHLGLLIYIWEWWMEMVSRVRMNSLPASTSPFMLREGESEPYLCSITKRDETISGPATVISAWTALERGTFCCEIRCDA